MLQDIHENLVPLLVLIAIGYIVRAVLKDSKEDRKTVDDRERRRSAVEGFKFGATLGERAVIEIYKQARREFGKDSKDEEPKKEKRVN